MMNLTWLKWLIFSIYIWDTYKPAQVHDSECTASFKIWEHCWRSISCSSWQTTLYNTTQHQMILWHNYGTISSESPIMTQIVWCSLITKAGSKPDPYYGHENMDHLCACFITHLFVCPEYSYQCVTVTPLVTVTLCVPCSFALPFHSFLYIT